MEHFRGHFQSTCEVWTSSLGESMESTRELINSLKTREKQSIQFLIVKMHKIWKGIIFEQLLRTFHSFFNNLLRFLHNYLMFSFMFLDILIMTSKSYFRSFRPSVPPLSLWNPAGNCRKSAKHQPNQSGIEQTIKTPKNT